MSCIKTKNVICKRNWHGPWFYITCDSTTLFRWTKRFSEILNYFSSAEVKVSHYFIMDFPQQKKYKIFPSHFLSRTGCLKEEESFTAKCARRSRPFLETNWTLSKNLCLLERNIWKRTNSRLLVDLGKESKLNMWIITIRITLTHFRLLFFN